MRRFLRFDFTLSDALFCAACFVAPWPKVKFRPAYDLSLADVVTSLFVVALLVELWRSSERSLPRPVLVLLGFCGAFLVVYLVAPLSTLETTEQTHQFTKALVRFGLHFALLIGGVFVVLRSGKRLFDDGLLWLCGGICIGGAYAAAQLLAERAGFNLDRQLLTPLTGVPARTLTYGIDLAPDAHRATGLTTDPNHLGVMLLVPILVLAAVYTIQPSPRLIRTFGGALVTALLTIQAATLSRSALVGAAAGAIALVLMVRQRALLRLVAPVAAAVVVLALMAAQNPGGYERIVRARLRANPSSVLHLRQYDYVPRALRSDPLFGVGLNSFALDFRPTGKKDFGPHSYYVQVLTETGLVGAALAGAFLGWAWLRLRGAVGATAVGLGAAFAATMVANLFYLTMTFYYFFAFLVFVVAAPHVLRR